MKIKEIKENKKQFLPLLLLADEQEDMIDRYLNRGIMYVLDDDGVKCECVVTDEGKGVLEIKNIATEPEYQGKGYGKVLIDFVATTYKGKYSILQVGTGDSSLTIPFYENADTSCIMAYYNYKLKENGINPKPCAITDDDGEVVADDFPPDYNYLQDYVYKIVSSFDFIESPEECTIKIADAFKCYTEKYYTGEEIIYFEDYSVEKVIELSEISKKWNDKFKRADKCKEEFLNLPICKKVKNIIDELSINEYVKNKGIVKKHKEKFTDKFKEEINSLKNTKYSSIYVVVCLIEQAVFLELLKDLTQLMSNDKIRLLFYAGGGILSFVIMLKILDMLVKKAGKKIEDDVLMEMQSKGEYVPEKTDKIVECATMLGYMSPFLCVSTWISGIENTQIYKWGIIILVHILGIGIPLLVKKKK